MKKLNDHEKLKELLKKKERIRYRIRKIKKKSDDDLRKKDIKDLQKYNKRFYRLKDQITRLRAKIRQKQVTSAYQTIAKRSKLTDIKKKDLLERNWYNTNWLDGHEHLTKMQDVQDWQKNHPNGTKTECERETGMSHHTIDKWWITI